MSLDLKIKKDLGNFKLDIEVQAGNEVLALLGASGCGKSMTLRCISGIVTPDEGHVIVNGRTLFDSEKGINLSPQERHVGLLFQNYALFPNMTVEQNIMMGMNGFKMSRSDKKKRANEMIEKFYLDGLGRRKPAQLSGGQQQRVALARIMVSKPEILMLDEPFSALDSYLRWELEQELLKVLGDFDGTSIIVSHNRDEVYRISDNIAVIADGKKNCYGDKESLFRNPPTYESAVLTGYRNFSHAEYIDEHHVKAVDWNTVIRHDADKDVRMVALRPQHLKLTGKAGENTATFRVGKAIDNLNEMILMLTTPDNRSSIDNADDFSWLNINVRKEDYLPFAGDEFVNVQFDDRNLLIIDN
ncbi:MAG: ATP-binding cassette domain-containing protein [Anaerovoracaceae bacterium]|nr:ATP-binding cassette domain-containing protein [Bacillota bacterium]MDY2670931.1 ATP-binding cassette domain-containing protein [Anaerovoracaceae bacterium]